MLVLKANLRTCYKKSAIRKLRQQNKCPAIIYGNNHKNIIITLNQNTMQHPNISKQIHKNNIIILNIEEQKKSITTKIQAIQYHPFKLKITHIDFLRIPHNNQY